MGVALKLRTYKALIDKVRSFPGVSKDSLIERIEREIDKSYSLRTLQRDLRSLKIEFGISISYDSYKSGYVIDAFDNENINFLDESVSHLNSYNSLRELDANSNIVDLSMKSSALMTPVFGTLIKAIKKKHRIYILHQKNKQSFPKEYEVAPLFLKEYDYKWYLIAGHDRVIKSFGIRRILEVEDLEIAINDNLYGLAKERLYNCLGVSYLNNEVESIHLAVTIQQSLFFDQEPLHHSQEKVKSGSEVVVYQLRLVINNELKMKIMSYGATVRVLEPFHFKQWFQDVASIIKNNVDEDNLNLDDAKKMFG